MCMRLTPDTRIKLSQIKDFPLWHKFTLIINDAKRNQKRVPKGNSHGGEFAREYNSDFNSVKKNLTKKSKEIEKTLSKSEKRAIIDYTIDSEDINKYARGERIDPSKLSDVQKKVDALDSALKKSTVGENIKVYRTLNTSDINKIIPIKDCNINEIPKSSRNLYLNRYLENSQITSPQKGYLSTTISPLYEMDKPKKNKTHVKYKINVPHEAQGLFIANLSKHPHQEELLILRGYDLDIKRIKYNAINDSYELEADIILKEKEK